MAAFEYILMVFNRFTIFNRSFSQIKRLKIFRVLRSLSAVVLIFAHHVHFSMLSVENQSVKCNIQFVSEGLDNRSQKPETKIAISTEGHEFCLLGL